MKQYTIIKLDEPQGNQFGPVTHGLINSVVPVLNRFVTDKMFCIKALVSENMQITTIEFESDASLEDISQVVHEAKWIFVVSDGDNISVPDDCDLDVEFLKDLFSKRVSRKPKFFDLGPSYKVKHDVRHSEETQEIIDAHNKLSECKLPKRPKDWSTAEWVDYLKTKHASFTNLLSTELKGTPESENYMRAAEYRDHLRDITKEILEAK